MRLVIDENISLVEQTYAPYANATDRMRYRVMRLGSKRLERYGGSICGQFTYHYRGSEYIGGVFYPDDKGVPTLYVLDSYYNAQKNKEHIENWWRKEFLEWSEERLKNQVKLYNRWADEARDTDVAEKHREKAKLLENTLPMRFEELQPVSDYKEKRRIKDAFQTCFASALSGVSTPTVSNPGMADQTIDSLLAQATKEAVLGVLNEGN
jgi:hypothetical protein